MATSSSDAVKLRYHLGLDAGHASVGWAVVELNSEGKPFRLHSAGVRRFEAGVEGDIERGKEESKSQKRREARGPRRNGWRRQWRLGKVYRILTRAGLLPESKSDHDSRDATLKRLDQQLRSGLAPAVAAKTAHVFPYWLRAQALNRALTPHELGRAIYHLAQRRGFLSNLKANRGDEDRGVVKKGISELQERIEAAGARTLGEYFASIDPEHEKIRRQWTARSMYLDEFAEIWKEQALHHPHLLTKELRQVLTCAIFHQRPLKSQAKLIGRCQLEPFKRRCDAASLAFQRFRMLQRLNDLELECPDGELRCLTAEERAVVLAKLESEGDQTWAALKALLGLKKSKEYGRHYQFNFEREGADKRLVGNRTAVKFAEALGGTWANLANEQRTRLVEEVLRFEDEDELSDHLRKNWNYSEPQIAAIVNLNLEPGYGSLSQRAIRKVLPLMEAGMRYASARKEKYPHQDKAREPENILPPVDKVLGTVRNPAVTRTLAELRKVVNALIRKLGCKPEMIRIELARDLKNSRKDRKAIIEAQDKNAKLRDAAAKVILQDANFGRSYDTPHNRLKVRLANECNWQCPYTGKGISMDALIGPNPQFDVEHIIPRGLSLDNGYNNKTLCYHDENRHVKKNRTPFQAYGSSNPEKWREILDRVRHFQGESQKRKLQLFQTEILPGADDFAERQLNDTRYLSKLAAEYLGALYGGVIDATGKRRVHASPGRVTAVLRDIWKLNQILGKSGDKSRDDHRHHAIDAFVIAVSTPAIVKAMSDAAARAEKLYNHQQFVDMAPPWEGFSWGQVGEVVAKIIVSSRVDRQLSGALHKETIYSKPYEITDERGHVKSVRRFRKPLEKMSRGEVEAIVDPGVRRAVLEKLDKIGGEPDQAFADKNQHPYLLAKDGRLIPIHSARITTAISTIQVGRGSRARQVQPGDNHHMEIIAVTDARGRTKWEGFIVSRYVANRRHQHGEPIVKRNHGPGKEFVCTLAGGEHVVIPQADGSQQLLRVTVTSGDQIEFVAHNDARPITIRKKIPGARVRMAVDKLRQANAQKVSVSPLGEITPARD